MKRQELRKIVEFVCNSYIDVIMENIDDNKKEFPYTIACANYISDLKEKNIMVSFDEVFTDIVLDKILIEFNNYIRKVGFKYEK